MIGQTVSHYKIIEKLGVGGMGVVYKARDSKLDRTVALKFLPPQVSVNDEEKKRFIHEAKAAAALDHPNICTVYEISETDDNQMFIAMGYYEGQTLKDKIAQRPLPIAEAIEIAMQIAAGLNAAHKKNIVHRDIKPANIIITDEGVVKILDFGLAKLRGATKLTREGTTLGTVAYMSPEQASGETADHRSDIWSLGVLLYEMITGQLPFKGDYEQAVIYAILNEEPEPITGMRRDFPQKMEAVALRLLSKNPDDRYENAEHILEELKRIRANLDTEQIQSHGNRVPSIAVLPFVNMSPDTENEYFSDGMTEDIINALSKIKDFKVAARTSTFSFKGEKIDIREIGKKLNIQTVLEGSVRKAGNRLRITAQLINVLDGYHIWSEQYDRVLTDIFAIQDEITLAIVDALKVELLDKENKAVRKKYTDNLEAYNLYLKGRFHWNRMTVADFRKAIQLFQEAVEKDPAYALAYTGLADAYTGLGDAGLSAIPPKEAFSKSAEAVENALEIDNDLAEAHASVGHLKMHNFDWQGAEQAYHRAIELNPNYATTYHMFGFYFALMERHEDAIKKLKQALKLDPISLGIITDLGVVHYFARKYDEAIKQYEKVLEMEPGFVRAYITLGSTYGQKGMYTEAIAMIQKAIKLSKNRSRIAALGRAFAIAGKHDNAKEIIQELMDRSKKHYVSPYCISLIYASMDEKDHALHWLEKAFEEHVSELIYLKVDPYLDKIRSETRFSSILKKVGLYK